MEDVAMPAARKKGTLRGQAARSAERELGKEIEALGEEFPFALDCVERLNKKFARVVAERQQAEAEHRAEHQRTRALLNTLFNGRIEKWIYASDDEDAKQFFKRVWRNHPATENEV